MCRLLKKYSLVVLLILQTCLESASVLAQDPAFSMAYMSPLYLSPSFAGLTNGTRLSMAYRDQWPGIPNTYTNAAVSLDHFMPKYKSGIGLLYSRDSRGGGQLQTQDVGFLYSYEIEVLHELYVRPGISFKYAERRIDPSKIIYGSQLGADGVPLPGFIPTFDRESYRKFDAGASAMLYSDFFWVGFSMDHLIKNNVGFTDMETAVPIRTAVYGGYKYKYKESYRNSDEQSVTLAVNYYRQQDFHQLDAGAYWYMNPFELGILYRGLPVFEYEGYSNNDALIMIVGVTLGTVQFAYSHDFTVSKLGGQSSGANEIALIYRFNQNYKSKPYRGAIPCSGSSGSIGGNSNSRPKSRKFF
jgi:type IX secretion system PorP/SprF family membrane protein